MTIARNDPLLLEYRRERDPKRRRKLADRLVRENQALVHKLVSKFARWAPDGIEFDDLMQAGYIGFLFTIDHIDTTKTFSTYCAYRIWYEVSKCCEKAGLIFRPRGANMPFKVLRHIEKFELVHGRRPTAEELGISQEQLAKWVGLPSVTSLDNDSSPEIASQCEQPDEAIEQDERWETLRRYLERTTDQDAMVELGLSLEEIQDGRRGVDSRCRA